MEKNVFGQELQICCSNPMTGYFRDGNCRTISEDTGTHTVCAIMTDEFLNFLHDEGYSNSNQGTIGISFSNEMYVNNNISNISELYNFKKTLQDNEMITPILDNKEDSSKLIKFTPLNPNDLLNVNHLLPPKSTWITPRI